MKYSKATDPVQPHGEPTELSRRVRLLTLRNSMVRRRTLRNTMMHGRTLRNSMVRSTLRNSLVQSSCDYRFLNSLFNRRLKTQQGSSLIISLIILIILMLLGVTAMNASTTQFKLAANLHFENMALNNAETAARSAEQILEANAATIASANPVSTLPDPLTTTWTDANSTQVNATDGSQRYMVGFVGVYASPLAGLGLDCTDPSNEKNYDCVNTYLITTRGQSQSATKFIQVYYAVPLK